MGTDKLSPSASLVAGATHGLSTIDIHKLNDTDLLAGTRQWYEETRESHTNFRRDYTLLLMHCQEIIDRFSDQHAAGEARNGKPTVEEAFRQVGVPYNTVKSWFRRHGQNIFPEYVKPPARLQLTEGEEVKNKNGEVGVATHVHEKADKVDVVYEGDDEAVTESLTNLKKVKKPVKKMKVGDLFLCEDNSAEYRYSGDGKLTRTQTPTLVQQKRDSEARKLKEKTDRLVAKAAENANKKTQSAEDARKRDEEKMANAEKARKELDALKAKRVADKAAKAAAKAAKVAAKVAAKAAKVAAKAAKKPRQGKKHVTSPSAAHDLDTHGAVGVGDKSDPTAQGLYWEFRKHGKLPYVVRNVNHPNLGILVECPSKVTAEMMIQTYEREAA